MATSARDLLAELINTAVRAVPTQQTADDAAVAFGHVSRALTTLSREGLHPAAGTERDVATRRLAVACQQVAAAWTGILGGRLTDLAGVTADAVAVVMRETTAIERWAITLRVGAATRHLANAATSHEPYRNVPEFDMVREAGHVLRRMGAADPEASGHGHVALDRPIPSTISSASMSLDQAASSAITLVDQLRRHVRTGGPGLSVSQTLITMRACEAVAARVADYAAAAGAEPAQASEAVAGWRAAWMALRSLRDGARADPRPGGDPRLVRSAAAMARAAWRDVGTDAHSRSVPLDDESRRQFEILVNQLPRIADQLELSARRWSATGQVCARADSLPFREDAPTPWLRHQVITLAPRDLEHATASIRTAGLLSAALAVDLGTAGRPGASSPQPHLTASYVARTRAARPEVAALASTAPAPLVAHRSPHLQGPRR